MKKPEFFSPDSKAYPLLITTNVIVTTFLAVLSSMATMIADSCIQGELALSNTQSIWLTTLYLLGINLTVPTGNWFANRFGFKRMYTYGVLIFTMGSLLAGLSQNFLMIALARFIEGIGGGFIFPIGLSLIVRSFSQEKSQLAINLYIALSFGAGMGFGVIIAGYFSQFHSWRDIFFWIVPFGLLAAFSCWLSRRAQPEQEKKPFDVGGFSTFAMFITCLLIALMMGPIRATAEGWRTPYILVFFLISIVSIFWCIRIEKRHADPLFPLQLFKDPIFTVSLTAIFLLGMAVFGGISTSIQYMLHALSYEKFVTGKIAAIYGLTIGLTSVLANYLSKIIPIPVLTLSGLFLLVGSYFYNNELSWMTGVDQVLAILVVRGAGVGLSLGTTTLLALYGVPPPLKSSAATILTFFRQVGGTYGTTLISIFSIRQTIFHAARFGEQANTQLPAYKMTLHNLYNKFPNAALAKASIVKNIETQAYIQGMNDALVALGYITGFVALILFFLLSVRLWKSHKKSSNPN